MKNSFKKYILFFAILFPFCVGFGPFGSAIIDNISDSTITLTDGTDTHYIKAVQEPGAGGRLTFGLDTDRLLIVCDAPDIDTDFGLAASSDPAVLIRNAAGTGTSRFEWDRWSINDGAAALSYSSSTIYFQGTPAAGGWKFQQLSNDIASGPLFQFLSDSNIELVDADGHQPWLSIESKFNQTGTSAGDSLYINATLTNSGDGTTGDGNNLINAAVGGTSLFRVDNTARIAMAESSDPAALADYGFLYVKDVAGTGEVFAADAAANVAQLTAHNDTMFTPNPTEAYPWMPYFKNSALGKEVGFDMSRALRDLATLAGNGSYIHYKDVPKINLETLHQESWKKKYIAENTVEAEVAKAEALEMVEVDERVIYYDGIITATGETKIVKRFNVIGEKTTGYEMADDGEIIEKKENVFETKKVEKPRLKENCRFDTMTGKFYHVTKPTAEQAETAAATGFIFSPPKYLADRLKE